MASFIICLHFSIILKATNVLEILRDVLNALDAKHPEVSPRTFNQQLNESIDLENSTT